jgi:hypothetical protein
MKSWWQRLKRWQRIAITTVLAIYGPWILALAVYSLFSHSSQTAAQSQTQPQTTQTSTSICDKAGQQKIIDLATATDDPLLVRTDDGVDLRYTFTPESWANLRPNVNSKFRDFIFAIHEAEVCTSGRPSRATEFYRWDGTRVAKVSPWTGVTID